MKKSNRCRRLKRGFLLIPVLVFLSLAVCAINVTNARYYQLLESERTLYSGLRSIDSAAAGKYIKLGTPAERR